jgi:hypothetical protein
MDANKLKKLKGLNYTIRKVCVNCKYSQFGRLTDFGTCFAHTYKHEKHTDSNRQLSVNVHGYCENHEYNNSVCYRYGTYDQFVEK